MRSAWSWLIAGLLVASATGCSSTPSSTAVSVESSSRLIADCVEFVPIGAFIGDQQATDLWNLSARDQDRVAAVCSTVAATDPAALRLLSEHLAAHLATTATATGGTTGSTSSAATVAAPPASGSTMPYVLCMNLRDAMARIRSAAGGYEPRTVDATGAERPQVVDGDWLVVSQDPAPGAALHDSGASLGVVEYGEASIC